ncbi:MAG: metallophosphoesterase [Kineosporiaceae bacterium]|nr:metallophosphoesterase [Kineosporiaceae bacterium]MBK7622060.1 metallophosphoesterase [Kineosporiaceae bacterium]MBK8074370.1 metallophosphoesterase [Kineosporiaceae bacterium]
MRAAWLGALGAAAVVAVGLAVVWSADRDGVSLAPAGQPTPTHSGADAVRVVVAADLACPSPTPQPDDCQQAATSQVALGLSPEAVVLPGDLQYDRGTREEFVRAFAPSWGRLTAITHPAAGNHEYDSPGAAPYFDYFGEAAGPPGRGWYSRDLGSWHVIALNSNCAEVGGCGEGSPQLAWLRADLARNPARCVMAFWHHPRWSHSKHGDHEQVGAFVEVLHAAGAELVFTGHDHNYQRFEPRRPDGARDEATGVRQFVIGTGGRRLYPISSTQGLDAATDESFGVLSLTLGANGYDWRFVPAAGGTYSDHGSATCH